MSSTVMIVGVFRVLGVIYARLMVYFILPTFYVTRHR